MSTIVCQKNFVSCFEPQLAETTTTLKLRVAAAPPPPALDLCNKVTAAGDHSLGSWGFLENNSQESSSVNKDCSYTHPLSKNSKLSLKSLQLCTENLGCESGSDTFSDCSSIFSASPPLSPTSNSADDHRTFSLDDCKERKTSPTSDKYCRKIKSFPPPLTTMSGVSSLQVRRRSDGGRLIIDAVEGPFRNSYLHAERSDGRLKLCFTTAACSGGEEEEEEEEVNEEEECAAAEGEIEESGNGFESEKEELDVEMNLLEKFQRFSRCKDGGSHGSKGLCSNWKPSTLWVATS